MHNQHSPHIDQATIDRWQADGAVLLKGVFTPWVDRLAEGVTALMASPSEYGHARTVIPKDGSPPFFQDYCNWSRIPAFSEFVFQSAAAEIAAALMQSQTAKFFHEHTSDDDLRHYPAGDRCCRWCVVVSVATGT